MGQINLKLKHCGESGPWSSIRSGDDLCCSILCKPDRKKNSRGICTQSNGCIKYYVDEDLPAHFSKAATIELDLHLNGSTDSILSVTLLSLCGRPITETQRVLPAEKCCRQVRLRPLHAHCCTREHWESFIVCIEASKMVDSKPLSIYEITGKFRFVDANPSEVSKRHTQIQTKQMNTITICSLANLKKASQQGMNYTTSLDPDSPCTLQDMLPLELGKGRTVTHRACYQRLTCEEIALIEKGKSEGIWDPDIFYLNPEKDKHCIQQAKKSDWCFVVDTRRAGTVFPDMYKLFGLEVI